MRYGRRSVADWRILSILFDIILYSASAATLANKSHPCHLWFAFLQYFYNVSSPDQLHSYLKKICFFLYDQINIYSKIFQGLKHHLVSWYFLIKEQRKYKTMETTNSTQLNNISIPNSILSLPIKEGKRQFLKQLFQSSTSITIIFFC